MRRLPPLNALRMFEAAARHRSFTGAAAELSVTQGAVSQQIHVLEDQLGVRLFERTQRGVRLTATGERYVRSLQPILHALADATEQVRIRRSDPLRICALPTFATRWLACRLPDFQQRHPSIELSLTISLQAVDFARDDIDVAICHGRPPWPGLSAERLFRQTLRPVCSPKLLDSAHPIRHPADLKHHTLLHVLREISEWPEWLQAAGALEVDATRGLWFDSTKMALDAAMQGLGVAMGRQPFVGDELLEGSLVAPFSLELESKSSYYVACRIGEERRHEVRVFREWLLAQLETAA